VYVLLGIGVDGSDCKAHFCTAHSTIKCGAKMLARATDPDHCDHYQAMAAICHTDEGTAELENAHTVPGCYLYARL
jgi:hypothetical protein